MATANQNDTHSISDILLRGSEYIKNYPDFKLVGRDEELIDLQTILMRKDANGVLLTGASGVGMSALCLGLQASKNDLKTPLDIVNTRFFWIDSDKLFESGKADEIHQTFDKIRVVLKEDPQTVLIIENAGNFIDAARNSGCSTIINGLLGDIKNARYQCILEAPYSDLAKVMKCDSDMQSEFTMFEVKEPKGEALRKILSASASSYEMHHGIKISPEAIETAAMLSEKYKTKELLSQPSGALTLIDRALSSYRLRAHSEPFQLQSLLKQIKAVDESLSTGKLHLSLEGKSTEELEAMKLALRDDMASAQSDWDALQLEFRKAYEEKRRAEQDVSTLEQQVESANANDRAITAKASSQKSGDPFDGFDEVETSEVLMMRRQIAARREAAEIGAKRFEQLKDRVNSQLLLTPDHILAMFSRISGIPVSKLTQDAREKLLYLDVTLKKRVFGQDHAVDALSDAVRSARMGLQERNKPQACFMFQGPSGTGKTEIVKALAAALFDDESALLRFDMSEYMEKHSVSRLVGAPPGYAGFEEGGELTNEMEKNPNRVILIDEIEKAHPDVFNIFLQVLDDARVTSGKGITSRFENTIIVMTTNVGANFFLDPNLTFEEASVLAKKELQQHFRNEFLNRFGGKENIMGFKKLDTETLERIAKRELERLNESIKDKGLIVSLSEADIERICEDRYDPMNGARAIPGYFAKAVRSKVAKFMLEHPEQKGVLRMNYDAEKRDVILSSVALGGVTSPANDIKPSAALARAANPQ